MPNVTGLEAIPMPIFKFTPFSIGRILLIIDYSFNHLQSNVHRLFWLQTFFRAYLDFLVDLTVTIILKNILRLNLGFFSPKSFLKGSIDLTPTVPKLLGLKLFKIKLDKTTRHALVSMQDQSFWRYYCPDD